VDLARGAAVPPNRVPLRAKTSRPGTRIRVTSPKVTQSNQSYLGPGFVVPLLGRRARLIVGVWLRRSGEVRACWQMITLLVDQAWTLRRGVVPIWDEEARRMLCGPVAGS
jgi:hypothetical protein